MPTPLPHDADGLLKLAAQSMFDLYAQTVQGMMVVDREHRVVWISEATSASCRRWALPASMSLSAGASRRWCPTPCWPR